MCRYRFPYFRLQIVGVLIDIKKALKKVSLYKIKGIKIECSDFTHSNFYKHSLSYKGRVSMRNSYYFTIRDGYSPDWWSMITSGGFSHW